MDVTWRGGEAGAGRVTVGDIEGPARWPQPGQRACVFSPVCPLRGHVGARS